MSTESFYKRFGGAGATAQGLLLVACACVITDSSHYSAIDEAAFRVRSASQMKARRSQKHCSSQRWPASHPRNPDIECPAPLAQQSPAQLAQRLARKFMSRGGPVYTLGYSRVLKGTTVWYCRELEASRVVLEAQRRFSRIWLGSRTRRARDRQGYCGLRSVGRFSASGASCARLGPPSARKTIASDVSELFSKERTVRAGLLSRADRRSIYHCVARVNRNTEVSTPAQRKFPLVIGCADPHASVTSCAHRVSATATRASL